MLEKSVNCFVNEKKASIKVWNLARDNQTSDGSGLKKDLYANSGLAEVFTAGR